MSAYQKLTNIDDIQFIIGPGCGSPQEAIAPLVANADQIVLLPSAASKELFDVSSGKIFNVQYSLEDESRFIADTFNQQGLKKVALITYNNAFSQTHKSSFSKHFDGEIIHLEFGDIGEDVSTELLKLKNEPDVEAIYIADVSFFFSAGLEKIQLLDIKTPIYSMYVVELPVARPLVEGVTYSFPDDISGKEGGTFELSKYAGEVFSNAFAECKNNTFCVLQYFDQSDSFDQNGISTRSFVLKKIVDGKTIFIK